MTPRAPVAAAGRRAAVLTGAAALAVAAIALKDTALEAWWLHLLRGGNRERQQLAAERLAELRSARAIPDLVALLGPLDREAQEAEREARRRRWPLGFVGGSRISFSELRGDRFLVDLESMPDPTRWELNWAAKGLARIGKLAVPGLIDALLGDDVSARTPASMALAAIGRDALPGLVAVLENSGEMPKVEVLRTLKGMGGYDQGAMRMAIAMLEDESLGVRKAAAVFLASRGADARPAILALIRASRDGEAEVRCYALEALSRIDADSPAAAAVFLDALVDPNTAVRYCAVESLARIGPAGRGAVPGLTAALRDPDPFVCRSSLKALRKIGPEAESAIPEILGAFGNLEDPAARELALYTLFEISPHDATVVDFLAGLVEDPDAANRRQSAEVLGMIGSFARDAVPELTAALNAPEPEVRIASGLALWKIDRRSREVVPVLMDELDPDSEWFSSAANALGEIGPEASAAIPRLLDGLRLKCIIGRIAAAGALWKIDPERIPVAVQAFIEILEEGDDFSTFVVAMFIRDIGTPPENAIPLLLAMSRSKQSRVRETATSALAKIRQD